MKLLKEFKAVISVSGCLAVGAIAGFFTSTQTSWYRSLIKPWFQPPGWVFAPAWTILYILMGISLYLVWREGFQKNKGVIGLFGVQLLLNFLWSFLFFSFQSIFYALLEIVALLAVLLLVLKSFFSISRKAGLLLVPYVGWVAFATALNLSLFLLN